jgi:hypothetical protein
VPDNGLAYAKIFPSIGIARVGNSPDQYFIGPEAPGIVPSPAGGYKDPAGRVKRQGARFRLYGFGHDGSVSELTADHPAVERITWKVTLANKKAEWYRFAGAKLVAEILNGVQLESKVRRNASVTGADRDKLIIGPSSASISGKDQRSDVLSGTFKIPDYDSKTVTLGELRTDSAGRLIVLGGHGDSASLPDDNPLAHYANNDGWHDDTSDGPIVAEVQLRDGAQLEVRGGAWVLVAPPHFSPHTTNIVSLYDVMLESSLEHRLEWNTAELGVKPSVDDPVSFERDVLPFLTRLTRYQWVSLRAHRGHASGKRGDFLDPDTLEILASPEEARKPESLHQRIFARIRTPLIHPLTVGLGTGEPLDPRSQAALDQANLSFMPPLAGDEGDVRLSDVYPPVDEAGTTPPETWLSVTELQYHKLRRWKDGDFESTGQRVDPPPLEALRVEEQPLALTRAALEACQGGAFFPGIEITSVARFRDMYSGAFRVNLATHAAGDLTKWMALPWQADFYECRDHWWPSIRPDDVVPVGDYEEILKEFTQEAQDKRLASLLVVRKRWDRGLGLALPGRPGLPPPRHSKPANPDAGNQASTGTSGGGAAVQEGETAAEYADRCRKRLNAFASLLLRVLPSPQGGELGQTYVRRLEEFLAKTLVQIPGLPVLDPSEPLDQFFGRVVEMLRDFLRQEGSGALPAPRPGETLAAYASRLEDEASLRTVWQGMFDVEWQRRVINRGKNDLAALWSRLGFVVPREAHGETVYVEADRGPFDLLSFRESFYYLMNIEQHPEFLPKARELAEEYLALARSVERDFIAVTPAFEQYRFFTYDAVTFQARLEKIYEAERKGGEAYNPVTGAGESVFRTPAQIVERIRQLGPFNQLDGGWLEKAVKTGPIDDIHAFLFEIWSDEIGNGDPAQNHANVYTDLMHSAGIYLPPITSRAYAEHRDIWEASFSSPAYQAAIAQFPEAFFPELLGMTLYLEWEAIYLPAMVKLYTYHGYNPLFYRLHVAIDNPVNGHGARARDAVMRYLDDVSQSAGPVAMQEHWRRVWDGYLAFKFVGGDEWLYRFTNPPNIDDRMIEMLLAKRHYGQLNHGLRRLGGNSINDLFDEPDQFLEVLASSDLVVRGDATRSPFFKLLSATGPMLKVFTTADRELWAEWINALPKDPVGGALSPGNAMRALIEEFRIRGAAVPDHASYPLTGEIIDLQSGQPVTVTRPVTWWFKAAQPDRFMRALADTHNGWIVPGQVAQSRFVTELLSDTGSMARFLSFTIPELGDRPARSIIIDWIAAGCPQPEAARPAAAQPREAAAAAPAAPLAAPSGAPRMVAASSSRRTHHSEAYVREIAQRTADATPLPLDQRAGLRTRRLGPGGGAAH